jgi:hypothetical protein
MKFRLTESDNQGNKTGLHRIENQIYQAGDVIESDRPLDVMFRNKFERVSDDTPASQPKIVNTVGKRVPAIPQPPIDNSDKQEAGNEDTPASASSKSYGKDVTNFYPNADLLHLKIYHSEDTGVFTIVDEAEGDYVVKTSKSNKNIARFLQKQLG